MTTEKFHELKGRLEKAKATAPKSGEGIEPQGSAPLTSTTGRGIPNSYQESGKEIFAAGSPQQHSGKISSQEQTSARKFTPGAEAGRQRSREKAAEVEAANREQFGQVADTAHLNTRRTEPLAIRDATEVFADQAARFQRDPSRYGGNRYIMQVFHDIANRFGAASPMQSVEAQRADVRDHHGKLAAKNADKAATNRLSFVTGAHLLSPGASASEKIPNTSSTQSMSDAQLAATFPQHQTAHEVGSSQQYKDLIEQMPTGSFNMLTGSRLSRQLPKGLSHVSFFHNLANDPRQLAESHMQVNLQRKDPARMASIDPVSSKTSTDEVRFPEQHAALYLPGKAPKPSLDHEEFIGHAAEHQPDHWTKRVENSAQEKSMLAGRLAQARDALSDASNAHSTGKMNEFMSHLQRAWDAASNVPAPQHTNIAEVKDAHRWLQDLGNQISSASSLSHAPEKDGKVPVRDAIRRLRDTAADHVNTIGHLGDAFDERHVLRADPKKIWNKENLQDVQSRTPDRNVSQSPAEAMAEKPGSTSQRYEETQPVAYSDPVHWPDNTYNGYVDAIRHSTNNDSKPTTGEHLPGVDLHSEFMRRQQQPGQSDNALVSEMKDHFLRNHLRYITHSHEFAGEKPAHPMSEEFLRTVPLTQMHNYISPNDDVTLGGQPARKFAERMSQNIAHEGMRHMDADERRRFAELNHKYEQHMPLSGEESKDFSELQNRLLDHGMASLIQNRRVSPKDLEDFRAVRFMAANRQQRQDYNAPDSSHAIMDEAETAGNKLSGTELLNKLKELKGRLPTQDWSHMSVRGDGTVGLSNPVPNSSRVRIGARRQIDEMIRNTINSLKNGVQKSMPKDNERLNKCRDSFYKLKKSLEKAVVPQGKYIRAADGTLLLVDSQSQAAKQQNKQVQQAQVQTQPKPAPAPASVQPKLPTNPPAPTPTLPPRHASDTAYMLPKRPATNSVPKTPDAPMAAPKMPVDENIEGFVQNQKKNAALSVFGYKPKR